jgi:hypothetical protein
VFLKGDKIRSPSLNFVTLVSYIGYNDDFKERILMTAFYLVEKNSMNPSKENDISHGYGSL